MKEPRTHVVHRNDKATFGTTEHTVTDTLACGHVDKYMVGRGHERTVPLRRTNRRCHACCDVGWRHEVDAAAPRATGGES